MKFRKHWFSR